jgi:hypothetical protein
MPTAALSGVVRNFFAQPAEHQSTLGIDFTGLISLGSILGPVAFAACFEFFSMPLIKACIEIRPSFPEESP